MDQDLFDRLALPVFLLGSGVLVALGSLAPLSIRHVYARYMAERSRGTIWGSRSVEEDARRWERRGSIMGTIFLGLGLVLFFSGLVVLGMRTM